jgi:hypothetical protein
MLKNLKEGTQLMSIYQPYFYIIQDARNGMYYAGAKWARGANPDNFMIEGGYTTSSETINTLIKQYGIDIFIIRKIKLFNTAEEAQNYETKYLRRINARKHLKFYNCHNNDGAMDVIKMKIVMQELYGVDNPMRSSIIKAEMQQRLIEKYGVDHYSKTPEYREKFTKTSKERYGCEYPAQSQEVKERMIEVNREKYGVDYYFQTDNFKEKYKTTMISKYGVENSFQSEEVKNRIKETNNINLGVDYPTQSSKVIKTMKINNMKKYGVENISQIEEVKNKKKIKKEEKQSREIVKTLRKYQRLYKIKISKCWSIKSNDYLEEVLANIVKEYGPLPLS